MADINQPAYPTTFTSGLTKLERVASEQLAVLISAYYSTDWSPSLEDADFVAEEGGEWGKAPNGMWGRGGTCKSGHSLISTTEQRIARIAIKHAKALLEMTQ